MATYVMLGIPFVLMAVAVAVASGWRPTKAWWAALAALLVLTAVFDSLIIAAGIVGYDRSKLLGVFVGTAPIEDFLYTIVAMLLVPGLWRILGHKQGDS